MTLISEDLLSDVSALLLHCATTFGTGKISARMELAEEIHELAEANAAFAKAHDATVGLARAQIAIRDLVIKAFGTASNSSMAQHLLTEGRSPVCAIYAAFFVLNQEVRSNGTIDWQDKVVEKALDVRRRYPSLF